MPGLRADRVRIDAASNEVILISGRESLRAHRSRQICSGQDAKRATRLRSGVPCQYAERCSGDPKRIYIGSAVNRKSIRSRCQTNPQQIKLGTDFGPDADLPWSDVGTEFVPIMVLTRYSFGSGRERPNEVAARMCVVVPALTPFRF